MRIYPKYVRPTESDYGMEEKEEEEEKMTSHMSLPLLCNSGRLEHSLENAGFGTMNGAFVRSFFYDVTGLSHA